jgi:hypothetical protein
MIIMMQVLWGYVVFAGLRIVGFACSSLVCLERDGRVTHPFVLCGDTFMLCILMLRNSYLNYPKFRKMKYIPKETDYEIIITHLQMLVS